MSLVTYYDDNLQVDFKITQLSVSGLKVNRLDLYGEVSLNHTPRGGGGFSIGRHPYNVHV